MKAVVLAGGLGTRLYPYTLFVPKPMMPLGDKPLLEHLCQWIKRNGIKDMIFCVNYLRKNIQDYFGDGGEFGLNIEYAVSDKLLATAGQLKTAENMIDDTFVCISGDSIFNFKLKEMIEQHKRSDSLITMALYEHKTKIPYGVMETHENNIRAWKEKPEVTSKINIGCYVMKREALGLIPKNKPIGMDKIIIKAIEDKKKIHGFMTKEEFIDIGSMKTYEEAREKFLKKIKV